MKDNKTEKIVIILGSGRSGTSLLTKALGAWGMSLSQNMVPGSYANPEGHFEDSAVVEIHKQLFSNLNAHPYMPLPENWIDSLEAKQAKNLLTQILNQRLEHAATNNFWGFKDPRTSAFIPLWLSILNSEKVVPIFFLTVRDPKTTVSSFVKQYRDSSSLAELAWLTRTTDALHYTSADCFIVHYEDWFHRPREQAQGILRYTGLEKCFSGNFDETLAELVKPNLNRAVYEDYQIQNLHVQKLYTALKECRGDAFDRERLMAVVKECRNAMNGFKGWYVEAQKHLKQENDLRNKLEQATRRSEEIREVRSDLKMKNLRLAEMEKDLHKMVTENNKLLVESKDLFDEVENYRKQVVALSQPSKNLQPNLATPSYGQTDKWRRETIILQHSYSFRLGQILINAFTKPGKNTYMMPYYLVKLVWDMITGRGREQLQKALQGKA